ncbi:MAG: hypothetical protein PV344_02530, partial [Anaplasma sp.]|nr:hypothetical protein [Anaplasma sp.]
ISSGSSFVTLQLELLAQQMNTLVKEIQHHTRTLTKWQATWYVVAKPFDYEKTFQEYVCSDCDLQFNFSRGTIIAPLTALTLMPEGLHSKKALSVLRKFSEITFTVQSVSRMREVFSPCTVAGSIARWLLVDVAKRGSPFVSRGGGLNPGRGSFLTGFRVPDSFAGCDPLFRI